MRALHHVLVQASRSCTIHLRNRCVCSNISILPRIGHARWASTESGLRTIQVFLNFAKFPCVQCESHSFHKIRTDWLRFDVDAILRQRVDNKKYKTSEVVSVHRRQRCHQAPTNKPFAASSEPHSFKYAVISCCQRQRFGYRGVRRKSFIADGFPALGTKKSRLYSCLKICWRVYSTVVPLTRQGSQYGYRALVKAMNRASLHPKGSTGQLLVPFQHSLGCSKIEK